jgi:hypothetical protein
MRGRGPAAIFDVQLHLGGAAGPKESAAIDQRITSCNKVGPRQPPILESRSVWRKDRKQTAGSNSILSNRVWHVLKENRPYQTRPPAGLQRALKTFSAALATS